MEGNEKTKIPGRVLIVDDEPHMIKSLIRVLREDGYELFTAENGAEALAIVEKNLVDVVLLDIRLPDLNGLEVLRHIKQMDPETVVIMMTGFGTIQTAVTAIKDGAFEFLTKPFENHELVPLTVKKALEYKRLCEENRKLMGMVSGQSEFTNLVGNSAAMQRLLRMAERLGQVDTTVLIYGETGTGKELLARAIHFSGPRKKARFVAVDCGSIPATLIESELFGHVKGAYTGAVTASEGLLKQADHGTIFLDEIAELPLEMQTRLLRFLQEKEVRPVGGATPTKVDVRVIAATNRDLTRMVSEGKFREDLFYRLNVVTLQMPPLRERKEDIPPLVLHFMKKHGTRLGSKLSISPEVLERLTQYQWPGNVRELENVIIQTLSLCSQETIRLEDLPPALQSLAPLPTTAIPEEIPLSLTAYEKLAIQRALEHCNGNVIEAAKLLNLGKSTLYRKIKELGINSIK